MASWKKTSGPCLKDFKKDSGRENILKFLTKQDKHSMKHDMENRKDPQMAYECSATQVNNLQNVNYKMTKTNSQSKIANATLAVPLKSKWPVNNSKRSHVKFVTNKNASNGKDNIFCPDSINTVTGISIKNDALIKSRPPRYKSIKMNSVNESLRTTREGGKSPVTNCALLKLNSKANTFSQTSSFPKKNSDISQWLIRKSDNKGSQFTCGKAQKLDKCYKSDNKKIQNNNSNSIENSHKAMDRLCSDLNIMSCSDTYSLPDKKDLNKRSRKKDFNLDFVSCGKSSQHNISENSNISNEKYSKLQCPIANESWNKPGPSTKYCWTVEGKDTFENRNSSLPESRTVQIRYTSDPFTDLTELIHSGANSTTVKNQYDFISNYMISITEDGLVKKKIIQEANGPTIPNGSLVYIHFTAYLESYMNPFKSSYYKGIPLRGVLGQNHFISGLDIGIRTMKKGEISAFLIDPEYGFGTNEIPCHNINSYRILIRVEVIKFRALHAGEIVERKTTHVFKWILKLAKKLYHQGVHFNELNRINLAAERFKLIIALLSLTNFDDKTLNSHRTYLINESMLNLAVFYNNKGRFQSAILTCLNILEQYPDNYKARLNFFKAVVAIRAYNKAYEFLKQIWKKKRRLLEFNNMDKEFLYSHSEKWGKNVAVLKQDYHLSAIMRFKKWSHLERLKQQFVQRYLPVKLRGVNKILFTTKWKRISVSM